MRDDEYWIMRPVMEGLCKYESLIDGTLDLGDVSRLNEALDVRDENRSRVADAMEAEHR
jgi:hypothetical protein